MRGATRRGEPRGVSLSAVMVKVLLRNEVRCRGCQWQAERTKRQMSEVENNAVTESQANTARSPAIISNRWKAWVNRGPFVAPLRTFLLANLDTAQVGENIM